MNDALDRAQAAAQARVAACGLALGRSIDTWSLVFAALALVGSVWAALQRMPLPEVWFLASLVAAAVQKYLALRVAFDEALFRDWAERWNSALATGNAKLAPTSVAADLMEFDQALAVSGLRPVHANSVRDLECRLRGARKLLGRQLLAFGMQFAACIAAILAWHFPLLTE